MTAIHTEEEEKKLNETNTSIELIFILCCKLSTRLCIYIYRSKTKRTHAHTQS